MPLPNGNGLVPPASLPADLGPFIWNPITFPGSGLGIDGQMQVMLHWNGNYEFSGFFNDPDFLDYDDSLVFTITSGAGVMLSFSHAGTMHGWGARWIEGGSFKDQWTNNGNNVAIQENWAALCSDYYWHSNAAINWDPASLLKEAQDIANAVQKVIQVVEVVAAVFG